MQWLSQLVVLFFALAVFVVGGSNLVSGALAADQETPALGWKMGHVYLVVPISGFFRVLFSIENLSSSGSPLSSCANRVAEGGAASSLPALSEPITMAATPSSEPRIHHFDTEPALLG